MSAEVICQGCGGVVAVPADYRRAKIQCPACGVICPVPADAPRTSARRAKAPADEGALEDLAASALGLDEPAPPPARRERERPRPRSKPKPAPAPEPETWELEPSPPAKAKPQAAAPVPDMEIVDLDDEDDDRPYRVEGVGEEKPCQECGLRIPVEAVLCPRCGYDYRKKKKITRTYEPIARTWEVNYPLHFRLTLFLALHGTALVLGVAGALLAGEGLGGYLVSWLVAGAALAFLMGTFDRIELVRDTRGRVRVTTTRRLAFFPLPPQVTEVRGFSEIVTGQTASAGFWEWFIFLTLLPGLIPAFVWWYIVIHKVSFHVALAREYSYPEVYVYRGRDEGQMRDVAGTLRDAAYLRWEGG
jgi:ribosomal protein L40E